ncbi:MAG: ABC transporter permease [Thermoleophilia bacterium]|nr:ABC transporter permease [Thermoleophilia bacterium]
MTLAWREVRRARLRFGLLAGAVGLLIFLVLFVQGLTDDLVTQFVGAVRNQDAPVLVYGADARRNLEGSQITPAQAAAVARVPGVAESGPLGEGTFTMRAGGALVDAVLIGVDAGGPGLPATLVAGRLPEADGEAVASDRDRGDGFDVGDVVRVEPGGAPIRIVGRARDINYSVSPTLFTTFPTYEAARRIRNPDARAVNPSAIAVRPEAGVDPAALAARIDDEVEGVEALTRQQAADEAPGVSAVQQSFTVVNLLFYIAIPLVTGLFFIIVTLQKAGALTLLRAIGAPASVLVRALLVQVGGVLAAGAALAVVLLVAADALLGATGASVGVDLSARTVVVTLVIVVVLSLLTALAAVRRILAIDPIRATTGAGVSA